MSSYAEILRVRREIAKKAGIRLKKRAIPRQKEPRVAWLRYQKLLRDRNKTMRDLVKDFLFPKIPTLMVQSEADKGRRLDSFIEDLVRTFSNLKVLFLTAHPIQDSENELNIVGADVNKTSSEGFQRQMKAALSIEAIVPEPFVEASIKAFVEENASRIEGFYETQIEEYKAIVSRGIRNGMRASVIEQELINRLNVSKSRASFLARDQTLKFFGELNRDRQTNVGIKKYTWDSSQDARVRPQHAILHGEEFSWDDPPIVDAKSDRRAHPGGDYQCRCQAIPIIPESFLTA